MTLTKITTFLLRLGWSGTPQYIHLFNISSMQKGGFGLNGAHFPKFGHFGSQILAHGFPKYETNYIIIS